MKPCPTNSSEGLRFVDPSVDPTLLWDVSKFLGEAASKYLIVRTVKEIVCRFPIVEYAVGFDGVDDSISIEDLDIGDNSIDIETKIWISSDNQEGVICDFADSDGDSILRLSDTGDEHSEIQAIYRNSDGIQRTVLSKIKSETWQDLRVWSDGNVFSVEVDGNQIGIMPNIEVEDETVNFCFGKSYQGFSHFKGMIKYLQVQSGADQLFNLQAGKSIEIEDLTDSASAPGIHNLRKGRFKKEFRT